MYLDYSKLEFDTDGNPEVPELVLRTMSNSTIGIIPGVHNLKVHIKFAEPSELTFDVPSTVNGEVNWIYDRITGHKIIYTEHYGVYMTLNPDEEADGISKIKHIKCYSIEKELDTKKFFLEEGTFKFYDQTNPRNGNTIMGRILEIAHDWSIGEVSPTVAQRYRTFDQYDNYLLSFVYGDAATKFRCVFVFDPYQKYINVIDADESRDTLPIYLDFDNLIEELDIEEMSDELVTAIRPYGADELDIRDVNPIGTNWLYDLSYFVGNGDIPTVLSEKWNLWQHTIMSHQPLYRALTALRASATARLLAAQAALADLQGELDVLVAQQSVAIQAIAIETTPADRESQQKILDEINAKISAKKAEIAAQEATITDINGSLDSTIHGSYAAQIQAIVNKLSITNFFTAEEYEAISHYLIEQDLTEDSFVATGIDTSMSGTSYSLNNSTAKVTGSAISEVDLTSNFGKRIYTLSGGTFSFSDGFALSGDIIRGTFEEKDDGQYVLSLYAGSIVAGTSEASSGMITASGTLSALISNIKVVNDDGITTYEGSSLQFTSNTGSLYLTANVSEYQKYSVQMELFDFAVAVLADIATPTYEFSVSSGNFLFANEFAPFRNRLELGKGIYLKVDDHAIIPYIIEFELDFEKRNNFSIVFSNRFKRHDNCNTLKGMIEKSYSSSRSFDASKYIYNQAANQASAVSRFMNESLDAAKNTILGASNQSVIIDSSGINVGGKSKYQIRIVDSMISMTDDGWKTAKLAIGLFASENIGTYWGVNADVIGGKLIVGNNLIIENANDQGVMQFKVDSSGAWLNNSTFVIQKDNSGKIIIDPKYGILAGNGNLFTTSGTMVSPSFIDSGGDIVFDSDDMPTDSNFYLDIRDGSAYFRGKVTATSGKIGGFAIEDGYLHTGAGSSYVALNGSGTNTNSAYAIWAGASTPASAKFYVKKDGTIYAKNGTFSGTLSAAKLSGNLTASNSNSWLIGCGININNGVFMVDQSGNVTMNGNLTLKSGVITWENLNSSVTSEIYDTYNLADEAYTLADEADSAAASAKTLARKIANGTYNGGTFINGTEIYSPTIYADEFVVMPANTASSKRWSGGYSMYGYYGSTLYKMFSINYYQGDTPVVHFESPCSGYASWDFPMTYFTGNCDFSGANVYGITAKFG